MSVTILAARRATHSRIFRSLQQVQSRRGFRCTSRVAQEEQLRKTNLYDFHVENGAKMVPFAGYSMPLSYGSVGTGKHLIHFF